MSLTHFDSNGKAQMVDVSFKEDTVREAVARGTIRVSEAVYRAVAEQTAKKGDVLAVATVAGVQGAKKTSELIPLCHILPLSGCDLQWQLRAADGQYYIDCRCRVSCTGKTGVEMEALTGVSTALLTVYDMCKAMDRGMCIERIALDEKKGGKSGHYVRDEK